MSDLLSLPTGATPAAAVALQPLTPTEGEERIALIDVLRGMALFGILAANIRGFAGPALTYFEPHLYWPGLADRIVQAFIDTFVQGKFITVFAFLFGVGFAAQLSRAEARGAKFRGLYVRRLLLLAVFGLAHGLLVWFGDILLVYALTGLFLLLFRKRQDRTLARWGVSCYFVPVLVFAVVLLVITMTGKKPAGPPRPTPAKLQEITRTYRSGDWRKVQHERMHDVVRHNWAFTPVMLPNILGLFLFGVLAWRRRFFTPAAEDLGRYRKMMFWGLAIGGGGSAALTIVVWVFAPPQFPPTLFSFALIVLKMICTPALSLGYICAVVLLFHGSWRGHVLPFAAIGRTALSNYLLQSILGTLVFYSYGLGLFGSVGPALLLPVTFIIYALQAAVSDWWLRRFRFGPAEWLWRSLTYGHAQPFVRRGPAALLASTGA